MRLLKDPVRIKPSPQTFQHAIKSLPLWHRTATVVNVRVVQEQIPYLHQKEALELFR